MSHRTGQPRTFTVPSVIASAHIGREATLDQLETIVRHESEAAEWAYHVVHLENRKQVEKVVGSAGELPRGLLYPGSDDEVVGLINGSGLVWKGSKHGYRPCDEENPTDMILTEDEVGFVARAFDEGKEMVVLAAVSPVAWLTPIVGADVTQVTTLPAGTQVVAVVDDLDRNAVIDLLAVAPGPVVYRRHDGQWIEDDGWVSILRSLKPPPLVGVADDIRDQVAQQVDEATNGETFIATKVNPIRGAGFSYLNDLERRTEDVVLSFALLAAIGQRAKAKAYDVAGKMPGDLQRYWLYGEGAAKIRWGTPGAWRRCHRHLVKYVGPLRAPGVCTNLGQHLGGKGVAWDVGGREKRALKHALKQGVR